MYFECDYLFLFLGVESWSLSDPLGDGRLFLDCFFPLELALFFSFSAAFWPSVSVGWSPAEAPFSWLKQQIDLAHMFAIMPFNCLFLFSRVGPDIPQCRIIRPDFSFFRISGISGRIWQVPDIRHIRSDPADTGYPAIGKKYQIRPNPTF